MRTQIIDNPRTGSPWFEYHEVGESRATKLDIRDFPFVIGRDESSDFHVNSNRVSRKHARIERDDDSYSLRDLDSTNGTYVNGKRVSETTLTDGDVLIIADFELTFFSGTLASREGATQVMTAPANSQALDAVDAIHQVRRLHEMLTHCSLINYFQPIVELESKRVFGYQTFHELNRLPRPSGPVELIADGIECRLTLRINQQHRLIAAEQASQLEGNPHIVFGLQVSEVSADFLPESLGSLAETIAGNCRLIAEIPDSSVCDIPYFRQLVTRLHDRGIKISYANFSRGPAQIAEWEGIAPDFVKLASSMTRDIDRSQDAWNTIQTLARATHDMGCHMIATGVDNEGNAQVLRERGCQYAQGDYFGKPEPITSLVG